MNAGATGRGRGGRGQASQNRGWAGGGGLEQADLGSHAGTTAPSFSPEPQFPLGEL